MCFIFRFSCVSYSLSVVSPAASLRSPSLDMTVGIQHWAWCWAVVSLALASSGSGPVLRLKLTPAQQDTLQTAAPTFFYLCQFDRSVSGVHSSSLLRNGGIELVAFDRLHDGSSDCKSLGAEHSDEITPYSPGQEGLTRRDRRGGERQWTETNTKHQTGGGWGDIAAEIRGYLLQTVFNVGIILLTGAARAGWLGPCGQWLILRMMSEVHHHHQEPGPAAQQPVQPPAPSQADREDNEEEEEEEEEIELREVCVDQLPASSPVRIRGQLPV